MAAWTGIGWHSPRGEALPRSDLLRSRLIWCDRQRFVTIGGGLLARDDSENPLDVLRSRLNSHLAVSHARHPLGRDGAAIGAAARHEPHPQSGATTWTVYENCFQPWLVNIERRQVKPSRSLRCTGTARKETTMLCFSATVRVTKKRNKYKKQAIFILFMPFKQAACLCRKNGET